MNIKSSEKIRLNSPRSSVQTLSLVLILFLIPTPALADDWDVITHTDTNSDIETQVAYSKNKDGYSLEIYKDNVGAIRSRFSLNSALDMFAKHTCPTYQIDSRSLDNR